MISVIVPVYKSKEFLPDCVESILNQSYKELEIILVDDGSPDECPLICDDYARNDNRIKVIHQKNAGVAAARNAGIAVATGEYVTFVDSDDYINFDMYEKMEEKAKEYNCDLVICDCIKEFFDHSEIYSHDIEGGLYCGERLKREYYPQLLITKDIKYPITISNCLCLVKKSLCDTLRYETGVRYSEDWLFGAQLALLSNRIYYMKNQTFYHYRMNPNSATHTFVPDKWNDYEKLYEDMVRQFKDYERYDFGEQLDKCLLFLVINSIGDILDTKKIRTKDKTQIVQNILNKKNVREMFNRLNILELPVSKKMKFEILLYKYRVAIFLLVNYYNCKVR